MKKLSIIIPVYYNEKNLIPLYNDIKEKLFDKLLWKNFNYEIVFVDDGSNDKSYEVIKNLKSNDSHIVSSKLSRNFGSHSAILAGLNICTGDVAVIKAADLQEPTEIILEMLNKYSEGNDVVLAIRKDRKEPFIQKIFADTYYKIFRIMTKLNMPNGGFDIFMIDRKVINNLVFLNEKNTSIAGQVLWCGYKTEYIYYTRQKREIGTSKWTLSKKLSFLRIVYTVSLIYLCK